MHDRHGSLKHDCHVLGSLAGLEVEEDCGSVKRRRLQGCDMHLTFMRITHTDRRVSFLPAHGTIASLLRDEESWLAPMTNKRLNVDPT